MGVTVYPDLEQRSPEWYEARRGIVTASTVGQLVTPKTVKPADNIHSRALVAELVAERITGWVEESYSSDAMLRGRLNEPVVRDIYAEHVGTPVVEVGFMVRDDWGFSIGYSPDGLVDDDGLIEIKSREPKHHLATVLADEVPLANMAQLQCGLLVSGRKWVDYLSFCGGLPLWRKRVTPDPRWREAIVTAVEQFEEAAKTMIAAYEAAVVGLPATERSNYDMEMVI